MASPPFTCPKLPATSGRFEISRSTHDDPSRDKTSRSVPFLRARTTRCQRDTHSHFKNDARSKLRIIVLVEDEHSANTLQMLIWTSDTSAARMRNAVVLIRNSFSHHPLSASIMLPRRQCSYLTLQIGCLFRMSRNRRGPCSRPSPNASRLRRSSYIGRPRLFGSYERKVDDAGHIVPSGSDKPFPDGRRALPIREQICKPYSRLHGPQLSRKMIYVPSHGSGSPENTPFRATFCPLACC